MINKREFAPIAVSILIITAALSLFRNMSVVPIIFISVFAVVVINILAKKLMGFYLDSEVEMKLWNLEGRFTGFNRTFTGLNSNKKPYKKFKRPLAAGIIFPLISRIILYPLGNVVWTASLVFDVKPRAYRAAKRHGLYSYSEITEDHMGFIAAAGIAANLLFAIVGYLIGVPEFSRINIYMAFFNMIPISDLDGNKILFGNKTLWSLLASLVIIAVGYNLFLV
ncbi:MAG: hypothetical protein KKC19_00435 [Nanoarchaeota archaeon]|nr:hypothetical protein [Nanoarchaeota archaeon]